MFAKHYRICITSQLAEMYKSTIEDSHVFTLNNIYDMPTFIMWPDVHCKETPEGVFTRQTMTVSIPLYKGPSLLQPVLVYIVTIVPPVGYKVVELI